MGIILMLALAAPAMPASGETLGDSNILHTGPATKAASGRKVTLEIDPKPVKHMTDLTFRITVSPGKDLPSTLLLDLSMPGMQMGKNQVKLEKRADGSWAGNGLIVRCMSGRKLWQATVLSPELGNPAFTLNVQD